MSPKGDMRAELGAVLAQRLVDEAELVDQLEVELGKARYSKKERDSTRIGRAAAAARLRRKSRRAAAISPARVLRAVLTPSPEVAPWKPPSHPKQLPLRLVAGVEQPRKSAESEARARRSARLERALRAGRRLVVAGSLDPRTSLGLGAACAVVSLNPGSWRDEVSDSVDLVLIEPLRRKAGVDADWPLSGQFEECKALIEWSHAHDIPTALWNTCDPFDKSFTEPVARLVDHVFIADLESVPWYASRLRHDRIHLCPVGTQPELYNPITDESRRSAALFAGGYDASCAPRNLDFETLIEGVGRVLPVEIHDANFDVSGDHNALWPEWHAARISGGLAIGQVGDAYRSYQVGLSVSTAKSSSSVIPRRVLDQLMSGTPTVSTFSRGVRVLLGELVPMSDGADDLSRLTANLLADRDEFDKRKAVGVRRVLAEHTYEARLRHIAYTMAGLEPPIRERVVGVVAAVDSAESAARVSREVEAQRGVAARLILVTDRVDVVLPGVRVMTHAEVAPRALGELFPGVDALAVFNVDDWHGPFYLSSMLDGLTYGRGDVAAKLTHYAADGLGATRLKEHSEYSRVVGEPTLWSRSVARASSASAVLAGEALSPGSTLPTALKTLAVDRFDYCQGVGVGEVPAHLSADVPSDVGRGLRELHEEAARVVQRVCAGPKTIEFDLGCLPAGRYERQGKGRLVVVKNPAGRLVAFTSAGESPWNVATRGALPVAELPAAAGGEFLVQLDAEVIGGSFGVYLQFLDSSGAKIAGNARYPGSLKPVVVPEKAVKVKLAFKMKGSGSTVVRSLRFVAHGDRPLPVPFFTGSTNGVLLLTDYYPTYELPYQRGFIHSRVKSYARYGSLVDVWVSSKHRQIQYSEYDGVDVMSGDPASLRAVLSSGVYRTVLVHSMYAPLWTILKDYLDHVEVVAWMHGAELHRWWLNSENPSMDEPRPKQIEQIRADPRFAHWCDVLREPHPNLRFVVVSQTFLDQMNEDLSVFGVRFPDEQTTVIYNPVSPERFSYVPKPAEQRKKLLSIRPFWQGKYANDLTVAAVAELASEPWFEELDILIAGDGGDFDEIVAPVRGLPNVKLQRRFFTQPEIAALHKEYGVALVPTRADSQGVSRDEAMSSGLVPITTAVDAVPEFVSDVEGYVVPGEDAHAMADAVRDLYYHPEKFLAKSAAAAERVRRTVSDDVIVPQEIATFRTIDS